MENILVVELAKNVFTVVMDRCPHSLNPKPGSYWAPLIGQSPSVESVSRMS